MAKKAPARRADSKLSNLVLEGGRSQRYGDSAGGHYNQRDAAGKFTTDQVDVDRSPAVHRRKSELRSGKAEE